jgi:CheY-like chemotaxis protein
MVSAEDRGTGMSAATLARVFEPFFTTKPIGQGTGLGLATIYGIVTKAGGHVQIYSELGTGTTITVLLPRAEEPVAERPPPAAEPRQGRGETILLVEDEDSLRAVTERILVRAGYRVLTAADGPAAITVASHHDRIDLLLTDVVMPHMPGTELAQHLSALRPGLPVVYLSGYAEPILNARSELPPDVTLLTKPVTEQTLLLVVGDTLDAAHV